MARDRRRLLDGKAGGETESRLALGRQREEARFAVAPARAGLPQDYADALGAIKRRIQEERLRIVLAANGAMVLLYWDLGRMILERQNRAGWGAKVIDRLAADLRESFPDMKGFSPRNLKYMRALAAAWPERAIVQEVLARIPWYHHIALLEELDDPAERLWYARQAMEHGWSHNILVLQIQGRAHERQGKTITNFRDTLPPADSDLAGQVFKDPYLFDFLGTADPRREREIEQALVAHVERFLLELGTGFAFVGRQVPLEVGDQDFRIDLLFYHLKLRRYVECKQCKNIERKEKPQKSPGSFQVRPFTVENMGVYQRAEQWQDFQTQRTRYRDEMIKVFGGEPVNHSPLLHGKKSGYWVHVGPLDAPVSVGQVWNIAREAQRTGCKTVTILSADFDTLSASEKEEVKEKTGVTITIRVIPSSAIDEVKRRLEFQRANPDTPLESMAIPAFYAPLSIVLSPGVSGRTVKLKLERCDVDIDSFVASQRPVLKPITEKMTAAARKKAQAAQDAWTGRQKDLEKWLGKAKTWQSFVDYWAVDWDYGRRVTPEGKPIFETDWQSFRVRRSGGEAEPLVFIADFQYPEPGRYRVAARVTDVFGNDGIATVNVEVK